MLQSQIQLFYLPSCTLRIHMETLLLFKSFSKYTPAKPLEKHAVKTAKSPNNRVGVLTSLPLTFLLPSGI